MRFVKMHGLGNDFLITDDQRMLDLSPDIAVRLSDRRTGIGFDQLLPVSADGDGWRFGIVNGDGTRAEQCGNGARCVVRWLVDSHGAPDSGVLIGPAGRIRYETTDNAVSVELPMPIELGEGHVDFAGALVEFRAVSMGNPHAVIWNSTVAQSDWLLLADRIAEHSLFPDGANVGFARADDHGNVALQVIERGAGPTRACGSGACAAAHVARSHLNFDDEVCVVQPGGAVTIRIGDSGVWLTGPAEYSFEGSVDLERN